MTLSQRLIVLVLLGLGIACCALLARARPPRWTSRVLAVALVAAAVVWSQDQGFLEGPTVVEVTRSNGLTIADLVIVPSLAVAGALLVRTRR